jgi:uncharacterized membrane protein
MNAKPNEPDEILFTAKEYSIWKDWKVNGWMFIALFISSATDVFFPEQIKAWPVGLRGLIAIAPFFAIVIWIRDLSRWIGGMDELHRRITLATCFFATAAVLFYATVCHALDRAEVWQSIPIIADLRLFFDPGKVWVVLSLMSAFFIHGYKVFNRRYK